MTHQPLKQKDQPAIEKYYNRQQILAAKTDERFAGCLIDVRYNQLTQERRREIASLYYAR